jgi:simple sugar transport system permease protein
MNLLSLGVCGTLHGLSRSTGELVSLPKLPSFSIAGATLDGFILGAIALTAITSYVLFRTRSGLIAQATGGYPPATEAAGFSVQWVRTSALLIAGAFAGFAGAYLVLGISQSFAVQTVDGRGFVAIAMVTFGRWRPWLVLAGTFLVGVFYFLSYRYQIINLGIPPSLINALPYAATLGIMIVAGRATTAPSALGQPYSRNKS